MAKYTVKPERVRQQTNRSDDFDTDIITTPL